MEKGDPVKVRRVGETDWSHGTVLIISENQASLIIYGDAIPSNKFCPGVGRVLLLGLTHPSRTSLPGAYEDILSLDLFEVLPV